MSRSRGFCVLAALLLVTTALAGCVGQDRDGTPGETASTDQAVTDVNPWRAGLDDHYPTPEHVETRSADERRAELAPPGDPEFAAFDATVISWMEQHDIPTGQFALMKDGQLLYTRGYGHADEDGTQPANTTTMFRIASVTKPMTAALVNLQVEQGLYNWTDPVFCVPPEQAPNCRLPIEPHPSNPIEDEQLGEVTVRHLIEHTGGWGRSTDWMLWNDGPIEIAAELGVDPPPSAWRTAQYLMGEELEDDPGSTYAYCNICYMLAGLVAEAATGATREALYDAYLFEPLEIQADIEPGFTRPENRNPREPFYPCVAEVPSVYDPSEEVCWPDGATSMRTIMTLGGLISTAEAVATVYEAYSDRVPGGELGPWTWRGHTGGLPGTATMAEVVEDDGSLSGTVQAVALFNSRDDGFHCDVSYALIGQEPPIGCSVYDLHTMLYPVLTGWGTARHAASDPGFAG